MEKLLRTVTVIAGKSLDFVQIIELVETPTSYKVRLRGAYTETFVFVKEDYEPVLAEATTKFVNEVTAYALLD